MPEKRYVLPYSADAQKRHHHRTEQGRVVAFMVQLEVRVAGEWRPVVRYDCAHGFAHRDRYNWEGRQLKDALAMGFDAALTFADEDLDDHWPAYRRRFLEGGYP